MPVTSVGDMAMQFISMRNGGAIKSELSDLAESLSSGKVTDITATLLGETARFAGIDYSLKQLDAYDQVSRETSLMLGTIQTALTQVDDLRGQTSSQLLSINSSSTSVQVTEAARQGAQTFDAMIRTLNTRLADRSLLGGAEVESSALATADAMLADIQIALGGATTSVAIGAVIDTWFDDPAGGFATMGYLGDTGPAPERRVSDNKVFSIDVRASDPGIRDVLKSAAFAAVVHDTPGLAVIVQSELLQEAGLRLLSASSRLIGTQTQIGFIQEGVERTTTENTAQRTSLNIARNDLISADPFDTASRLQSVQLQLETHYSVTARMSRLSLLDYI